MPIDIFVPKNALDRAKLTTLATNVTETLLQWTDATQNAFLRSNVSVFVHELPASDVFAGGKSAAVARVDVKVPTVALTTQERRDGFTADVTKSVRDAAVAPLDHVWVFISNAVEGGWGIDGKAFTSEDMS